VGQTQLIAGQQLVDVNGCLLEGAPDEVLADCCRVEALAFQAELSPLLVVADEIEVLLRFRLLAGVQLARLGQLHLAVHQELLELGGSVELFPEVPEPV
jgi:hypothetical protein